MTFATRKNIALLGLLYFGALCVPGLHHLALETETCTPCETHSTAGPHIGAACPDAGPCQNEDHHHHGGPHHDHDNCVLCELGKPLVGCLTWHSVRQMLKVDAPALAVESTVVRDLHLMAGHFARPPPTLS